MKKLLLAILLVPFYCLGQGEPASQTFTLTVSEPSSQLYHVEMVCTGFADKELVLAMPNWTPGYYQLLHYAKHVDNFKAVGEDGQDLAWRRSSDNTWTVTRGENRRVKINYTSKATIPFVANSLLDAGHGYIMPAGVFMHVRGYLNSPVTLTVNNYPSWSTVATGLSRVPNQPYVYSAPDFDTFYDSPILLGNLEQLESFFVEQVPHHFIGYQLGDFDKKAFIQDLQKIVQEAAGMMGDIPYEHYTFLAIGAVPGGIEHLNSTGFGFSSQGLGKRDGLLRMYSFLSHEYFHHYNVKRVRPVELGPFDYDNGSKTTMLWISEGFTNYYDELIVKRAGIMTKDEYLNTVRERIQSYENRPGRLFQSASEASYQTWSDGPFGRTGDDAYKTISVYEKGSLLGLVLDLFIRHHTKNKKSLDDVMRYLYAEYYLRQNRGFTESEFKMAAEKIAGRALPEFFNYVNTTAPVDFSRYLRYAGLSLTHKTVELPQPYSGLATRMKGDSLYVNRVDWQSPAWEAGIRSGDIILSVNGDKAGQQTLKKAQDADAPLRLSLLMKGETKDVTVTPGRKSEKQFSLQELAHPSGLQQLILKSWLKD